MACASPVQHSCIWPTALRRERSEKSTEIRTTGQWKAARAALESIDSGSSNTRASKANGPVGRWEPLVDDAPWKRVREHVSSHQRLPRQARQRYLLTGLLRCPDCGARMQGSKRHGHGARYRCSATNLGANAATRECRTSALSERVDEAVLAEVVPVIEIAVSEFTGLREAFERAWAALRKPATLQDELQERQRQQLFRDAEQARSQLTMAAVLFADGDIDKPGYELLRDKARTDLVHNQATSWGMAR